MNARAQARTERPRLPADAIAPLGSVLQEQDTHRVDLAQRLHRDVAGGLVACTTLSEMIRHELQHGGGNPELSGMLTSLETALRQTIQVVRDLTGEQLPSVLKTFGIGGALRQLVDEAGSPIELTLNGDEPALGLSQRLCLHQVLQALIQRIRHHAAASRIEIVGSFDPARVEILIEHDGTDVMRALSPGDAALAAIKGRLSLLGGRLLLSRQAEDGLRRARVVVPLPVHTSEISPQSSQPAALS